MREKSELAGEISRKIQNQMQEALAKGEDRLPPEKELAAGFGVSRTLVRDCLDALEQEGFVTRLHGVGTRINRHVVNAEDRIDLDKDFLEAVARSGYTPSLLHLEIDTVFADEETAAKLLIEPGSELVRIERLIGADGTPVISCEDYVPKALIRDPDYGETDFIESSYRFLCDACQIEIRMDLADLGAVRCGKKRSRQFGIPEDEPMLRMTEVGYDLFGNPRMYSVEHYREGIMRHLVLRKKVVN